jgi:phosphoglycolate phosphatase-like HAD superfamily hydrolase
MYIIDFDDTVFDTVAFKAARKQAVLAHGVSPELFDATYRSSSARGGYANESHAQEIAKHGFEYQKLVEALETTTQQGVLRELMLPDAEYFLQTLRATGKPLVLLTYCNPEFQQRKVHGSGIIPYFDDCILTPDSKLTELRNLFVRHPLLSPWFINDKIEETKLAHEAFPQLRPVLKMVPGVDEALYGASGLPAFKTLREIADYVIKQP